MLVQLYNEILYLSSKDTLPMLRDMTGDEWPDDTLAPWKVILFNVTAQLTFPGNWDPCGGTLIDKTTILTTASCFHNNGFLSDNYHNGTFIFAGDKMIRLIYPVQIVDIIYPIGPHNYQPEDRLHDIAIVKLSKRLEIKDNFHKGCLPDPKVFVTENNTKCGKRQERARKSKKGQEGTRRGMKRQERARSLKIHFIDSRDDSCVLKNTEARKGKKRQEEAYYGC